MELKGIKKIATYERIREMTGKQINGIYIVILLISINLPPLFSQNIFIFAKDVNQFSPDLADDHFKNALVLFNSGKTDSAVVEYEKALNFHPGHTASLLNLAFILSEKGENMMAVNYIKEALSIDPENPIAHYNLGVTYRKMGRLDDAKMSYESALKFNELMVEAYSNLGRIYELKGQYGEAEENYRKALEIKPDFQIALLNIGVVLLNQEQYLISLKYLQKLTDLDPSYESAYYYAAVAYYFLGDYISAWQNVRLSKELGFSTEDLFLRALSSKLPEPENTSETINATPSLSLINLSN